MDSSGAHQRKGFNARDFVKTNKKPVTVSLAVIGKSSDEKLKILFALHDMRSNKQNPMFEFPFSSQFSQEFSLASVQC